MGSVSASITAPGAAGVRHLADRVREAVAQVHAAVAERVRPSRAPIRSLGAGPAMPLDQRRSRSGSLRGLGRGCRSHPQAGSGRADRRRSHRERRPGRPPPRVRIRRWRRRRPP